MNYDRHNPSTSRDNVTDLYTLQIFKCMKKEDQFNRFIYCKKQKNKKTPLDSD